MGSRSSRHHKATSPYSSWGQSFDDLVCGPGKICEEDWTPLHTRSQSLVSVRSHRRHSVAPSGAEVYTVRRHSYEDGIIDQQPMPIDGHHLRSPYHMPPSARSRRSKTRRSSYYPREPSEQMRRPVTPWNPKVATRRKKKKRKRKSLHRVDTYPLESARDPADSEIVQIHRQQPIRRSKTRSKSSKSRKKPSTLDGRPPWKDVLSSRQYQEYLDPSPIAVVPPFNSRSLSEVPGPLSRAPRQKKSFSQKAGSSIMGSNSIGSGGTRVVPPKDKTGAQPPPAFRVTHLEDKKYKRIPTAFLGRK